jgi:hypothetical protein
MNSLYSACPQAGPREIADGLDTDSQPEGQGAGLYIDGASGKLTSPRWKRSPCLSPR